MYTVTHCCVGETTWERPSEDGVTIIMATGAEEPASASSQGNKTVPEVSSASAKDTHVHLKMAELEDEIRRLKLEAAQGGQGG